MFNIFPKPKNTTSKCYVNPRVNWRPKEMFRLARVLKQRGFNCYLPLLKAHAGSQETLAASENTDWLKSLEEALQRYYKHTAEPIHLVGLCAAGIFSHKFPKLVRFVVL